MFHRHLEDDKGSSDDDMLDYAKPVGRDHAERDVGWEKVETRTLNVVDKADDAYKGVMKVFDEDQGKNNSEVNVGSIQDSSKSPFNSIL